jgi:hypothetical protein
MGPGLQIGREPSTGRPFQPPGADDCLGGKLPLARFSDMPSRCSRTRTSAARIAASRRAVVFVRGLRPCVGRRKWAQAGPVRRVVAQRSPIDAGAGDGEGRVDRDTRLNCGMRLVKSIKLREGEGQLKICSRIISVGLDRSSAPCDRLLPTAEMVPRQALVSERDISRRIARG